MAVAYLPDAAVHPMADEQAIEKPLDAGQLAVGYIKCIGIVKRTEVVVDASLLDVGAGPTPFDVRVL